MPDIRGIQALIIDMDGVLWRGRALLPGVRQLFDLLRAKPMPFILASNNSAATLEWVRDKLRPAGVDLREEEIVTSSHAASSYLGSKFPPGTSVYVIGEQGLRSSMEAAGFRISETSDGVKAVVVGLDFGVTWAKLTEAAIGIQEGALFLGTNPDLSYPIERGLAIGNGALLAALQATTGHRPVVMGKPEPHLFLEALRRLGTSAEGTLVIGDRLETDILGAKRAGFPAALVLTGVSRREDIPSCPAEPDFVFENLVEACRAIQGTDG